MADEAIDNELLEFTAWHKGTTGSGHAKGGSSNRRRAREESSDAHSDSKSENDFDDDAEFERGEFGRKEDGSKVPLKKRFESDKDGEDEDRDGYESDDSFGSDLYRDDEDRARLAAMSERQRETILYERSELRNNKKLRNRASQRSKQLEVKTTRPRERDVGGPSSRMRSSASKTREAPPTSQKIALNNLVAKRNKQGKNRDATGPVAKERYPSARNGGKRSESEYESESDADDASSREDNRSDRDASDDDDGRKREPEADVNDIKSITIRRSKLAKWFMEPFFDELIAGCFVRIGIGVSSSGQSIYRVCLVKNVDQKETEKLYKFENRLTFKYLNCVWGDENSAARWQMVRASDQAPSEKEILEMEREVERCGGTKLSKAYVDMKKKELDMVSSYVYTAGKVREMLVQKKQATTRPSNIAVEKDRIAKELGVADSKGDAVEVEKLHARLKELEEFSLQSNKSKDAKALALAEMNRRNKFENFKNASDLKPKNTDAKAGEAGYDPFSRRWTRSQNYYKTDAPKVEKEGDEKEVIVKATIPAPSADKTPGNRIVPLDGTAKLFALHDFDLHMSLAQVRRMGGSQGAHNAYMARKQKLEGSWGAQVDNSDGRRHALTLTVNDYKRRRGLL